MFYLINDLNQLKLVTQTINFTQLGLTEAYELIARNKMKAVGEFAQEKAISFCNIPSPAQTLIELKRRPETSVLRFVESYCFDEGAFHVRPDSKFLYVAKHEYLLSKFYLIETVANAVMVEAGGELHFEPKQSRLSLTG